MAVILESRPGSCEVHKYRQSNWCKHAVIVMLILGCYVKEMDSFPSRHHRGRRVHGHRQRQNIRDDDNNEIKCPPPSPLRQIPSGACIQDPCLSDDECIPPAVIDWLTQNMGEEDAEYYKDETFEIFPGEVLASINRANVGEMCSTTIDQEYNVPLDCPHGYICHIEDEGDVVNGIPDRGRCVKAPQHMDIFYDDNLA